MTDRTPSRSPEEQQPPTIKILEAGREIARVSPEGKITIAPDASSAELGIALNYALRELHRRRHSGEAGPTTRITLGIEQGLPVVTGTHTEDDAGNVIVSRREYDALLAADKAEWCAALQVAAAECERLREKLKTRGRGSSGDCRDAERLDWLDRQAHWGLGEPDALGSSLVALKFSTQRRIGPASPLRDAIDAAMAASPSSETPRPCDHRSPRRDCSVCCDAILNLYFTARDAYAAGEASSPTPPTPPGTCQLSLNGKHELDTEHCKWCAEKIPLVIDRDMPPIDESPKGTAYPDTKALTAEA